MRDRETIRTTFAQDTKMTSGILHLIARVVKNSVTPIKEREVANKKYLQALEKATTGQKKSKKPITPDK